MFTGNLFFSVFSIILCFTHQQYLEKRRDYFLDKLRGSIDEKLYLLGFFDAKGSSVLIPRAPRQECNVTFYNGKKLQTGLIMSTADIFNAPSVTWDYQENHLYTLYIGDLDSKMHMVNDTSDFQAFCICLIGNIPGCDVQNGTELFEYFPTEQKLPHELHRHLVLVYDQNHQERVDFEGGFLEENDDRQDFRVDKFAEWYNFGIPLAANVYLILDDKDYH